MKYDFTPEQLREIGRNLTHFRELTGPTKRTRQTKRQWGKWTLDISDVQYGKIEKGTRPWTSRIEVETIARFFNLDIRRIIPDIPPAPPPQHPPESLIARATLALRAYVPVYAEVGAGGGMEPIDHIAATMNPVPETLRAYRVRGLCLDPEIRDGDTVLVDTGLNPENGDILFCIMNDQVCLKRLRIDRKGNRWLEDNHGRYNDKDCNVHGIVVGFHRRLK